MQNDQIENTVEMVELDETDLDLVSGGGSGGTADVIICGDVGACATN